MTTEQKDYLLSYDLGLLTRVARATGKSRAAVHKVYRGHTRNSPVIAAELDKAISETLRQIQTQQPPGAAAIFGRGKRRNG